MLIALRQVAKAQETEVKIDEELKELQATLANIEEARPFEDLTVSASRSCGSNS
jgi:F-type H+-transporting ATPase subunit d